MILDDENVLVSNAQEAISNPLNFIKMMRDDRGTFNRVEVMNTLRSIFNNIPDTKDTHYLTRSLEQSGWFIDVIDEHHIVITEHPRKCNGFACSLFEITTTSTDKGLLYSIYFNEHSCTLSSQIKSYMINKYKLIRVGSRWVPEQFKQEWTLNI